MKRVTMIAYLMLLAGAAWPQENSPSGPKVSSPGDVTKIVRVRYGRPRTLAYLMGQSPGMEMRSDDDLKVIVLRGDPARVALAEQTLHELDTSSTEQRSRDVELVVSVIGGSNGEEGPAGGPIPEEMAPVVKQLRTIFPYRSYQVLSSMLLRSREGTVILNDGVMKSVAASPAYSHPSVYTIRCQGASVSSEGGRPTVHLADFQFHMKVQLPSGPVNAQPVPVQPFDVAIVTNADLREGQKVVVGKANVENGDSAVFVVLAARLVE